VVDVGVGEDEAVDLPGVKNEVLVEGFHLPAVALVKATIQ
jgi:hypothetical protein